MFGQDLWVAYFFFYLFTLCRFYPQYCPIPVISYPQLENELFCNIFYLRHLCDTEKFPDWPIREPVRYCTFQTNFESALLCNWFKSACATVKASETCRQNRLSRGRILFLRFAAGHACLPRVVITHTIAQFISFLTRELRACARASYRYHVGNGIRSLDWSIPVNFFRF